MKTDHIRSLRSKIFISDPLLKIRYNYTVEVRNRFKGLDLIDRVPDELWMEVRTGDRNQDHPQEKEMQKKQNGCLGRPYK